MRETVLGPRLFEDVERIEKALAALRIGDAIGRVAARVAAAPGAEDKAAVAHHIDRRGLLGEAQRMGQRQHMHRGPDLDALRTRGDLARDIHRCRQSRAPRLLVDFRQPENIDPPAAGRPDLPEPLRERIGVTLAFHLAVKFMIPAEFHFFAPWGRLPRRSMCYRRRTLGRLRASRKYRCLIRPITLRHDCSAV